MKKVLFLSLAAVCLFQLNGLAQKSLVGITAGVTSSNIFGNVGGVDKRLDARTGFTVGMVVDAPLGKSRFSFQPAVHYMQKGGFTVKTDVEKKADALRYADVVLNFVHSTKNPKTQLFFGLGPQIGLNLPSKKVSIEDGKSKEVRSIAFGETAASDYRGLDWGANGLAGLRFKKGIFFSVSYTFGLRNIIPVPTGDDKLRNSVLGFRLGYFFPNNTGDTKKKKEKKEK